MAKHRLLIMLPVLSVLITSGLWLWSRHQYDSLVGRQSDNTWVGWTDYTPVPLEIAGALNVPVATFGYPLYHLLHEETKTWELFILLLGVAAQWAYIGSVLEKPKVPSTSSSLRRIAGAIGILFGAFVLLVTIPMHHVAGIYKSAAVAWSFAICFHCLNLCRRRAVQRTHSSP